MEDKTDTYIDFSFPKKEKLKSKKKIDALFTKGASFYFYPFSIRFDVQDETEQDCHQMMVSVSKRNFKRAVDRNRVKRLIREAYRHHKHRLAILDGFYSIAYIYTAKEIHDYHFVEKKLTGSIDRLLAKIEKKTQ